MAIQQKICSPVGMAIIMLAAVKKLIAELRQAGREHVVHPQAEAEERRSTTSDSTMRQVAERPAAAAKVAMIAETMPSAGTKMM